MLAILYIAIAQFIFGGLLAMSRPRKQLSDFVLAIWFALMAIFMGLALLKNLYPVSVWSELQLFPFFFTFGPFLFLYVRAVTASHAKLGFADGLHLLPFVVFSVAAVTGDMAVDESVLNGRSFLIDNLLVSLSSLVSIATYIILTFKILIRHNRNLLEHFSYTSEKITLSWLKAVLIGFIITMLLTILASIVNVFNGQLTLHPGYFLFFGFAVFAFGFTYYGTRQPAIYSKRMDERFVDSLAADEEVDEEAGMEEMEERYVKSSLTPELADSYIHRLLEYLGTQKPFLKRDLTLQDVAVDLDIPAHHITQAINGQLNKNFYTLINEFRIQEAKARLLDPKLSHITVLAIAHDAGFNSKSSFNMTFKKYVGVTPSEFRRGQQP